MPTPNFEDAPDGSSSINHTGSAFSEEVQCFWEDIDPWGDVQPYPTNPVGYSSEFPPHPSYADGSAPAANPLPNLNAAHMAINPNRRIEARMFSQGERPPPLPPPQTATQVNEAQRRARVNPAWESAAPNACESTSPYRSVEFQPPPLAPSSPPRRQRPNQRRRDEFSPIRKDPNAWSLREAIELCKLLEVVVPEAGFHIALTGGLLCKEGRQARCDLVFYQIRGTDPNYEVLWKYLTVAGVLRQPEYSENGWLVRATYRGKLVDCLFPNAKKVKKVGAAKGDCYKFSPPTPPIDSAAPLTYDPELRTFIAAAPAPIPPPTIHSAVAAARIVEAAASAFISPPTAEAQDDIPF